MSLLNNLNPNYYKTIVERGGRIQQVIYSTLDNLKIIASDSSEVVKEAFPDAYQVDVTKDLCIYADTLTLCDSIVLPSCNVKIICRQLILNTDINLGITPLPASNPDTQITTAARGFNAVDAIKLPPTPPDKLFSYVGIPQSAPPEKKYQIKYLWPIKPAYKGATGKNGVEGKPAGRIELITQLFKDNGKKLSLIAKGGKGGLGQGGMKVLPVSTGKGGVGYVKDDDGLGKPVETELDYHRDISVKFENPRRYDGSAPTVSSDGQDGGDAGYGGVGGKGGEVRIRIQMPSLVSVDVSGGDHGDDGIPGSGTPGTKGGILVVKRSSFSATGPWDPGKITITVLENLRLRDGKDGKDGKSPDRAKTPGIGTPGNMDTKTFIFPDLAQALDSTYWLKVLQHAKNLYHYLPPTKKNQTDKEKEKNKAYILLNWIVNMLYELQLDKIVKGQADESPSEVIEAMRKKEIRDQAFHYVSSFDSGLNIYGKTVDWVPLLKLETYQNMLKDLIDPFTTIEANFKDLAKQAEKKAEKDISFNQSMAQFQENEKNLKYKIDYLYTLLPEMVTALDNYTADLITIKDNIMAIVKDLKTDIKDYVDCDISKIFKALEMIAFDPENMLMAGVQLGNYVYGSLTTIAGKDKQYVYTAIDKLEGDLNDSTQAIFNADNERTSLLIVKLDEFNKEMGKVEAKFPKENKALNTATAALKAVVGIRSKKLIEYNVTLATILKFQNELSTLESKKKQLNGEISEASDPTLTGTVSYFAVLYQNLRDQMMELVYIVDRAYQYWSIGLQKTESAYEELQKKVLWVESGSDSFAQFGAADLTKALADTILKVGKQKEIFHEDPQTFPIGDIASKIKVIINEKSAPGLIKYLQTSETKKALKFPLIKTVQTSNGQNEFTISNTDVLYNIRVNYIRPRLIFSDKGKEENIKNGVTSASFYIEHQGKDTIYLFDKQQYSEFEHEPTNALFTQSFVPLSNDRDFGDLGTGNLHQKDYSEYASLGIYTTWKIILLNEPYVDISKVESIEIEFGCDAYLTASVPTLNKKNE